MVLFMQFKQLNIYFPWCSANSRVVTPIWTYHSIKMTFWTDAMCQTHHKYFFFLILTTTIQGQWYWILCPFYRWEKWDPERLNYLSRALLLISEKYRKWRLVWNTGKQRLVSEAQTSFFTPHVLSSHYSTVIYSVKNTPEAQTNVGF